MGWIISFVVFTLTMTILTAAGLRQPTKASVFTLPALRISDRLITVFVTFTFISGFIYGLTLLAAKILP